MKRLFDFLLASAGLVVLSPLFLLVAMAIKLDSPGPVFFRQERVGRHGRPFRIFKFRTMTVGRSEGMQLTVGGDARITRVGAFLRAYKIDELAQLIDVLRGTMSLVGPRPEVPRYVAAYPPQQRERVLSVRPGITDFASILYRDENSLLAQAADPEREYLEVVLPEKLRVAVNYVDHASLAGDIKVLGLTVKTVFVSEKSLQALRSLMQHQGFWRQVSGFMAQAHHRRRWIEPLLDGLAVLVSWHVTYLFRLGFERWQPGRPWYDDYVSLGVVAVYLACLSLAGIRRSMWRFFAFDDFRRLMLACFSAGLICAAGVLMMQLSGVARAVLVLHPLFTLLMLVMMRSLYRIVYDHAQSMSDGHSGEPRYAVVLGAGQVARRVIAGLHQRDGWFLLAVLDDDASKHGTRIGGVPVEGGVDMIRDPGLTYRATHAIIALDDATPGRVEELAGLAMACGLTVMSVPRAQDLSPVGPS